MIERRKKFMNILKFMIGQEHAIEGEWYSNVSPYIDDLEKLYRLIDSMIVPTKESEDDATDVLAVATIMVRIAAASDDSCE